MGIIFSNGWLDDLVGLGVDAGILTQDDSPFQKERFRNDLQKVLKEYGCGEEKYSSLEKPSYKYINQVKKDFDFEPEIARLAAREAAIACLMKKPKKLWCVCPEMRADATFSSQGGETSGDWKHREEARKAGKDVPIGGCICMIDGQELAMIVDLLQAAPSS